MRENDQQPLRPLVANVAPDAPARTIREWRLAAFLTQTEMAEALGVSPSVLSLWERGRRRPHMKNLRQLAERLGVQPQQIRLLDAPTR